MENIVAEAEKVIKSLVCEDSWGNKRIKLTTGQIRKFLTAVNRTANKVEIYRSQNPQAKALPENMVGEIQYLQVQLVYQAGRERSVKEFIDKDHANLIVRIRPLATALRNLRNFAVM